MDIKKVIDHLQIIHTWAAVGKNPIYNGIEPKCCEDIEKWTEDALDLLKEQGAEIEQLNRFVNGFSRDAMPVVQCKDCRWGDWSRNGKGEKMILCYNGDTGIEDGYLHEPNWFCAEGERKEGR